MFTTIFNKIFDQLLFFTFIKTVKTDFVWVKTLKIIYQSNEPWLAEIHGTYVVNIFPIKLFVEFKFRISPLFPRIVYRLSLYYWNVKCICSVVFGRFQICCHFFRFKIDWKDSFGSSGLPNMMDTFPFWTDPKNVAFSSIFCRHWPPSDRIYFLSICVSSCGLPPCTKFRPASAYVYIC